MPVGASVENIAAGKVAAKEPVARVRARVGLAGLDSVGSGSGSESSSGSGSGLCSPQAARRRLGARLGVRRSEGLLGLGLRLVR
eukprot:scaffold73927_cov36-Phaeocystis_antarctica.AAC.1